MKISFLASSGFSISGLCCVSGEKSSHSGKGKDDICFPFVCFIFFVFGNSAFTVLPNLCGCEIFNRFPFSNSHEDIDYSPYSPLSLSLSFCYFFNTVSLP